MNIDSIDSTIVREIYDSLGDELSRCVFGKRLQYSFFDSAANLREVARLVIPEFIDKIISFTERGDNVCVYGVGNETGYPGRRLISLFDDKITSFGVFDKQADTLKEISYYCGYNNDDSISGLLKTRSIEVHKPETIRHLGNDIVMIVGTPNYQYQVEIVTELISLGVPFNKIAFIPAQLCNLNEDYFNNAFFEYTANEVFIDCGCLNGQTSKHFLRAVHKRRGNVSKIIAFEPDEANFDICKHNMVDVPFFEVRNFGVWNEKTTLKFSAGDGGASAISSTGDTEINTVTLNEALAGERVTFIKMDIEGAELNALKGAENIIRLNSPKLAISVYHKSDDIIRIPEFILSLSLDYKLFLRHQTGFYGDTILYAAPKKCTQSL